MPSTALGSIGFAFEPTAAPGEQIDTPPGAAADVSILAYSAVAGTASATNQPTGSGGMRMHVYVYSNTATGTVTIAGKDINGNVLTETIPASGTIPIAPVNPQSQETGRFDYCTVGVYSSINTSGITTTGLTNGFIKIGGVYAGKYMAPGTLEIKPKYGEYSPDEHRALGDRHSHKIQTVKDVDVSLEMALYPDTSVVVPYIMANSVTTPSTLVTNPGSATVLLAAAAVSGSPLSLTTQPTAPGMKLILVVASSTAVGSIAISGLDIFGKAQSETIVAPAFPQGANGNGTYYSANVYSAVNAGGLVVTGLTTGTLAVTGVFGWNRNWLPSVTPYTNTIEHFLGSESVTAPFTAWKEFDFSFDVGKEITLKASGIAQDRIPIGSRTATPLTTSNIVATAQPIDRPNSGWACQVFIDPITGTAGTTPYGQMLSGSIKIQNELEGIHTMTNRQVYQQVGRSKWICTLDAKIVYTDVVQMEQFRQDSKQLVQLNFYGRQVSNNQLQQLTFIIPLKFTKFEPDSKPSMKFPEASIAGIGEYEPSIGASYKVTLNNSVQPPTYTS